MSTPYDWGLSRWSLALLILLLAPLIGLISRGYKVRRRVHDLQKQGTVGGTQFASPRWLICDERQCPSSAGFLATC